MSAEDGVIDLRGKIGSKPEASSFPLHSLRILDPPPPEPAHSGSMLDMGLGQGGQGQGGQGQGGGSPRAVSKLLIFGVVYPPPEAFQVGQRVRARDGQSSWALGTVTSLRPDGRPLVRKDGWDQPVLWDYVKSIQVTTSHLYCPLLDVNHSHASPSQF